MISTLPEQIWRIFSQRWLFLLWGGITLCLVISAFALEQLPDHLRNDPNAMARWMRDTSLHYGNLGDIFRNLGLFNLLHSRLLHVLLTLTGLLLLIRLANLIDAAYTLRRLPDLLDQPHAVGGPNLEAVAGHALSLHPTYQTIFRRRTAHALSSDQVIAKTATYLKSQFGQLHRETIALPIQPISQGQAEDDLVDGRTDNLAESTDIQEERLLAIGSPEMIYLQILSVVGLLLATLAVSLTVVLGWEIETEALVPGEHFRDIQHNFELDYHVVPPSTENDKLVTHLETHIGDVVERLSVAAGSFVRSGAVRVWAAPDQPALLVSSLGETPLLARPGQFSPSAMLGLHFPSPGSEESIILPRQRIGLRIVRTSDSNLTLNENSGSQNRVITPKFPEDDTSAFMVEIFREASNSTGDVADSQALERYYIGSRQPTILPVDGLGVLIRLDPVPSLRVEAYYMPGIWLAWPAFVMILIGMAGCWRQPRFLLIQICPWPVERTVVVIQGNVVADVESVKAWLDEQSQG